MYTASAGWQQEIVVRENRRDKRKKKTPTRGERSVYIYRPARGHAGGQKSEHTYTTYTYTYYINNGDQAGAPDFLAEESLRDGVATRGETFKLSQYTHTSPPSFIHALYTSRESRGPREKRGEL